MPQRLHPRPVRRRASPFPASPPRHFRAAALRLRRDFFRQASLADSRFSNQAKQLTATARDAGQARAQLAQLALAPDEGPAHLSVLPGRLERKISFAARHGQCRLNSLAECRCSMQGHDVIADLFDDLLRVLRHRNNVVRVADAASRLRWLQRRPRLEYVENVPAYRVNRREKEQDAIQMRAHRW